MGGLRCAGQGLMGCFNDKNRKKKPKILFHIVFCSLTSPAMFNNI